MKYRLCHIRLTGLDKHYYRDQIKRFCLMFDEKKVQRIDLGKQDLRGGISITIENHKDLVVFQKFFMNKMEMLGFISGFVRANEKDNTGIFCFIKKIQNQAFEKD